MRSFLTISFIKSQFAMLFKNKISNFICFIINKSLSFIFASFRRKVLAKWNPNIYKKCLSVILKSFYFVDNIQCGIFGRTTCRNCAHYLFTKFVKVCCRNNVLNNEIFWNPIKLRAFYNLAIISESFPQPAVISSYHAKSRGIPYQSYLKCQ